jgi:hypothetical protein
MRVYYALENSQGPYSIKPEFKNFYDVILATVNFRDDEKVTKNTIRQAVVSKQLADENNIKRISQATEISKTPTKRLNRASYEIWLKKSQPKIH